MGVLGVTCAKGCKCDRLEVDALDSAAHESVLEVVRFNVTQSPDCTLALEVLGRPNRTEHKFKARGRTRGSLFRSGVCGGLRTAAMSDLCARCYSVSQIMTLDWRLLAPRRGWSDRGENQTGGGSGVIARF